MTLTANPHEMLLKAAEIINERGQSYGGIEENFQLIADMFTLRIGREFHPYEVCVLMECLKDARMFANPAHMDNYLDGINYRAFAAFFAQDYMNSRAQLTHEIAYRNKKSLKAAEMQPVEVAKKGGRPLAVNLDAIEEKIARQA